MDLKELDVLLARARDELVTLLHVEKHRTPIGGFVVATQALDAIREAPGGGLMLHPAGLKGMHNFKTREHAEEIACLWNDDVPTRGPQYQDMRVAVMTKKEHLLALIPHHRMLIESFEEIRARLVARAGSSGAEHA